MMRLLSGFAAAALLAGCSADTVAGPSLDLADLPATITLAVGQHQQIGSAVVRFAGVTSDSRCPSDVTCVWQGNAELEITVGPAQGRGPEFLLELNSDLEPRTGIAMGLELAVIRLLPTPVSNRPTRGYRVELRVSPRTSP